MLRPAFIFTSCLVAATLANAQTIVPVEREPIYTKEDIFEKLTPLAPATTAENEASAAPATAPAEANAAIETDAPATTLEIREPESTPPAQPSTTTPPPRSAEPPAAAAAASTTPAPLSPKLRAMLRPAAQGGGPSAKLPAHAPGAMTSLSAEELRTLIGCSADQFHQELGELKHGERWQTYLRLEELQAACQVGADMETVETLPAIGLRFATLASQPEYLAVTKRNGFQTLHLALGEFLSLDDERGARQQLLGSVQAFQRSLAPVGTGAQWNGYFELAALHRLGASPQPVSEHDLVQLQLILARFEQAATDEQFSALAQLKGFDATQVAIREILGVTQRPTPPDAPAAQPEAVVQGEVTIAEDATSVAHASATVERLPIAGEGLQLVSLGGKAFLKKPNDASWKQIGKASAAAGDAIAARDEAAQLVLGESFALRLAAQTTVTVAQRAKGESTVSELKLSQGTVKAIANSRTSDGAEVLYLAAGDYQLAVSGDDFAVEFRVDKPDGRVVAIVHAGQAAVENSATGDAAVVRAGREAVLLAGGIALRKAPARSEDWWPSAGDKPRSARRNGGGFSQ